MDLPEMSLEIRSGLNQERWCLHVELGVSLESTRVLRIDFEKRMTITDFRCRKTALVSRSHRDGGDQPGNQQPRDLVENGKGLAQEDGHQAERREGI